MSVNDATGQPKPRKKRPPKKSRKGAKVLFFVVFLAIFVCADLTIMAYEMSARREFDKSRDHLANHSPQQAHATYLRVIEEFPYSYVACRARQRLSLVPPEQLSRLPRRADNYAQISLQVASREVFVPLLRKYASKGWPAAGQIARLGDSVERATYAPTITSYVPLIAGLLAFIFALYMFVGFWRLFQIRRRWKTFWLGVTSAFLALQCIRVVHLEPDLLGQLTSMTYYPEVEFLSGLSLLLVLFCLLFSGRPEKKRRSRAGSGNAQETA